ncbi:MAG: dienelactone hydrolase family protein [Vicinamibacterales bacterium]
MSDERVIETQTHGRYLIDVAPGHPTRPLVVGFHGYGEHAATQLDRLRTLRGSALWDLVSVQALHRFYRRNGEVTVASWMTREDRDAMISDNIAYTDNVLNAVAREVGEPAAIVCVGFSQGASMAYRAAALCRRAASAVVVLGGDLPPDLDDEHLTRLPRVLVGRGVRDSWFTEERCSANVERLRHAQVDVRVVELDAGHEWTDQFTREASDWIGAFA